MYHLATFRNNQQVAQTASIIPKDLVLITVHNEHLCVGTVPQLCTCVCLCWYKTTDNATFKVYLEFVCSRPKQYKKRGNSKIQNICSTMVCGYHRN